MNNNNNESIGRKGSPLTLKKSHTLAKSHLLFSGQVNLKYDAWQKELQGSFATILAEETRQVRSFFGS